MKTNFNLTFCVQFVDISENALYYLIFHKTSSMQELFYLAKLKTVPFY